MTQVKMRSKSRRNKKKCTDTLLGPWENMERTEAYDHKGHAADFKKLNVLQAVKQ